MIRDAASGDEFALAKVHLEARSAGYGQLLDAAYNASLTLDGYVADWRKRLAATHRSTLVDEVDGEVRGFTRFGDAPNARKPVEGAGVLELIYVLPKYWGTGAGAALLAAAEVGLVSLGFTSAFLAVYEENRRARAFYERHGWTHDGVSWQLERGSSVTQVRYVKALKRARIGVPGS